MLGVDKKKIYLDNAASTEPSENVIRRISEVINIYGNPSSIHDIGQQAKRIILESKNIISSKFCCASDELYFTSGATMSNNLFIQGFMREHDNCKLIITTIEHDDIIDLANYIDKSRGTKYVYRIPVNSEGFVNLDALNSLLSEMCSDETPILFACQWANGECGTIQDIERISQIVHSYNNCFLYVDATQYAPYFHIDLSHTIIDGLGMSGQKMNCIKGTGILYVRNGIKITPMIFGEQGLVGGTENVVGIAAISTAINDLSYDNNDLINKRNYLLDGLKECGYVIGSMEHRLPNNIYMRMNKCDSESFVVLLNEFGVCASSGSACGSMSNAGSHVVQALGYTQKDSQSCVRFTLSDKNTYQELDYVIKIVNDIINLNGGILT